MSIKAKYQGFEYPEVLIHGDLATPEEISDLKSAAKEQCLVEDDGPLFVLSQRRIGG
jgi:hypothetical protein